MRLDTIDTVLVSSTSLTPDVAQLLLRAPDHTFSFTPGQHVGVAYESADDGLVHRSYSPVSRPGTNTVALMVKRYDDGTCSVWLHDRSPGDTVHLTSPSGNLHLRDLQRDAVFLATGTGLTPMVSMIQQYLDEGTGHATLIYGERTRDTLAYRGTLDLWTAGSDRFDVVYTLSRADLDRGNDASAAPSGPGAAPSFRSGYVQDHLGDLLREDTVAKGHMYVCGVPQMVVDTRSTLVGDLGVEDDRVFSEGWEDGAVD